MKQKKITIDGHEYPVEFNLSTLIVFEQTVEHSFFEEDWRNLYCRAILIWAAMFSADDSVKTDIVLRCSDWQGVNNAFSVIVKMADEFFNIPKIVEDAEKSESVTSDAHEDGKKN